MFQRCMFEMNNSIHSMQTSNCVSRSRIPVLNRGYLLEDNNVGSNVHIQRMYDENPQCLIIRHTNIWAQDPQEVSATGSSMKSKQYITNRNKCYSMKISRVKMLGNLKARIIARKYAYLYLRKVFGDILPSSAMKHYNKRLIEKTYSLLRRNWWENKVQWRLLLRANLHFRSLLLRKGFLAWKCYQKLMQNKKIKANAAGRLYIAKLKTKVFARLKICVFVQVSKDTSIILDLQIFAILLLQKAYLKWIYFSINQQEVYVQDLLTYAGWKFILLQKCVRRWKSIINIKKEEEDKARNAINSWMLKLERKHFVRWKQYVHYKKLKHNILSLSEIVFNTNMLKINFRIWKAKYDVKCKQKSIIEMVHKLQRRAILDQYMMKWRNYSEYTKWKVKVIKEVNEYYRNKLKRTSLSKLQKHASYRQKENTLRKMSEIYFHQGLMKRTWEIWQKVMEKQEMKEHFDVYEKASQFCRSTRMKGCLRRLRGNLMKQRRKKMLQEKTDTFLRNSSNSQYFQVWWNKWQDALYEKEIMEKACELHGTAVLKGSYNQWRMQWLGKLEVMQKHENAAVFYMETLAGTMFTKWQLWARKERVKRGKNELASEFRKWKLMVCCVTLWKQYVPERKREEHLLMEARRKLELSLQRRAFQLWIKYHHSWTVVKDRLRVLRQRQELLCLSRALCKWKVYIDCVHIKARKIQEARNHFRERLLTYYFICWKMYIMNRKEKVHRKNSIMEHGNQKLRKGQLKTGFNLWRQKCNEIKNEKMLHICMKRHFYAAVKKQYFNHWYEYHQQQAKKRMLQQTEIKYKACYCTQRWFKMWRVSYYQKLNENNKITVALIYWSHKLEKKLFKRWQLHTEVQLCKKQRFLETKEYHQHLLLNLGSSEWIVKANVLSTMHRTTATNIALQSAVHELNLEQKYWQKWRTQVQRKTFTGTEDALQLVISNTKCFTDISPSSRNCKKTFITTDENDRIGKAYDVTRISNMKRDAPRIPNFLLHGLKQKPISRSSSAEANSHHCTRNMLNDAWEQDGSLRLPFEINKNSGCSLCGKFSSLSCMHSANLQPGETHVTGSVPENLTKTLMGTHQKVRDQKMEFYNSREKKLESSTNMLSTNKGHILKKCNIQHGLTPRKNISPVMLLPPLYFQQGLSQHENELPIERMSNVESQVQLLPPEAFI